MTIPPPVASTPAAPTAASGRWKLAWLLLAAAYLLFGLLYSVIQPPTALPDEGANMQYVRFLSDAHRLPRWEPSGAGPGGYEAQHPPLAYGLQALVWGAGGALPENIRWHVVRWSMVLLGLLLLPITARLGRRLFSRDPLARLTLAATVQVMPLSLLYLCHANPDGVGLIVSALGLGLAARVSMDADEPAWLPWAAGAVAGLAALTKLSVAPVGLVLLAAQWLRPGQAAPDRFRRCGALLAAWLLLGGWWYARDWALYGQPFIHTAGRLGTGLGLGARMGLGPTARFTLSETFLSAWAQRGWFPAPLEPAFDALLVLMPLLALAGFVRRRAPAASRPAQGGPPRFILGICLGLLLFVFVSQQIAFWAVDVELNAGGRYLLAALPATAVLLVAGVSRLGPRAAAGVFSAWLLLLGMNVAAAYNIASVLTPHYFPGWHMFEFPGGHT